MANTPSSPTRSRRDVIAASLGGVAALVVGALGRPEPTVAGSDGDVVLGSVSNSTYTETFITCTGPAFAAFGAGSTGSTHGVQGLSGSGNGVWGHTEAGKGVRGTAHTTGVGVYAEAVSTGIALQASGKVKFSRSGKTKILAGASSKSVSLAGVTTSSMIFAVLNSNRTGRWVRAVVPGSGSFIIYLNTSVATDSYISWFVLN